MLYEICFFITIFFFFLNVSRFLYKIIFYLMNETDEELILRILDDNYDIDGHLIHKIEEPKKNSLPSSPKDDVIEIESLSQEDAAPQEKVQIKIQNSIEIKNDTPIIEENLQKSDSLDELFTNPHEKHNQE